MTDSNLGKWDGWFLNPAKIDQFLGPGEPGKPRPVSYTETYRLGAEWLSDCQLVEDWGCGMGWLRTLIPPERYRGIDGSGTPYADEIVDLVHYRSRVPGIFMRHVLEHNHNWGVLLDNAVSSFTYRMALILFTPLGVQTEELVADRGGIDAPVISFCHEDLVARLNDVRVEYVDISSRSAYGCERVYYLEKR